MKKLDLSVNEHEGSILVDLGNFFGGGGGGGSHLISFRENFQDRFKDINSLQRDRLQSYIVFQMILEIFFEAHN